MNRSGDTAGTGPAHAPRAGAALIGGHPVLDFTNTVAWRTDPSRRVDRVGGIADWTRWADAAGVLDAERAEALRDRAARQDAAEILSQLRSLTALRTTVSAVLDALVDGAPPPAGPWQDLRRDLVAARQEADLPPSLPIRWQARTDRFADLTHALALRTDELLSSPLVERVRRCQGPGCGWFFLDRSRNATRRWCSSGDCGNRERARRHYRRSQG
ncbi:CGNR zinc finger domain-containing protein [Streptomyces sp. NPDC018031]|uniref:CGNR zinc finger domain-containing protein n=1 Tax=Streptomyces sp. NPDC018031 TaxID=3365033 RepID=UPI0037887BF9